MVIQTQKRLMRLLTSHPRSVAPEGVEPKDMKVQDAKTLDDTTTQNVKRYFQPSSDASFADNPDRKSSHGFLFKLFNGPIAWMSKKQTHVSTRRLKPSSSLSQRRQRSLSGGRDYSNQSN
ncbi:hypothetical protein VE03_10348 [Pseudogymnoascus sp. 23342-1-I1]|nr:hypothetical protein VE03_10348 [Pseudogymnoascus sp. 23342-1-I1]